MAKWRIETIDQSNMKVTFEIDIEHLTFNITEKQRPITINELLEIGKMTNMMTYSTYTKMECTKIN